MGAQRECKDGCGARTGSALRRNPRHGARDGAGQRSHTVRRLHRRRAVQLLAGLHARARDLAQDIADELSHRVADVDDGARSGCAGETRQRQLGLARRRLPEAGRAILPALTVRWRRGRQHRARVRYRDAPFRWRRVLAAEGEAADRVAQRRHVAGVARMEAWRDDGIRISFYCEAAGARAVAGVGGRGLSRRTRRCAGGAGHAGRCNRCAAERDLSRHQFLRDGAISRARPRRRAAQHPAQSKSLGLRRRPSHRAAVGRLDCRYDDGPRRRSRRI